MGAGTAEQFFKTLERTRHFQSETWAQQKGKMNKTNKQKRQQDETLKNTRKRQFIVVDLLFGVYFIFLNYHCSCLKLLAGLLLLESIEFWEAGIKAGKICPGNDGWGRVRPPFPIIPRKEADFNVLKSLHLNVSWIRKSLIDPISCNLCIVLSMFLRLVLANPLFSLRDINLTLGFLPPRRHVMWLDSVVVESFRLGLKSECADTFHQHFLWLLHHLKSSNNSETDVYSYNPALF